jgi:hypothetical protein
MSAKPILGRKMSATVPGMQGKAKVNRDRNIEVMRHTLKMTCGWIDFVASHIPILATANGRYDRDMKIGPYLVCC